MGARWKNLSTHERLEYQSKARQDRVRYANDLVLWQEQKLKAATESHTPSDEQPGVNAASSGGSVRDTKLLRAVSNGKLAKWHSDLIMYLFAGCLIITFAIILFRNTNGP